MPPRKRKAKGESHGDRGFVFRFPNEHTAVEERSEESDAPVTSTKGTRKKKAKTSVAQPRGQADDHGEDDAANQSGSMTWNEFQKRFNEKSKRDMDEYLEACRGELRDAHQELLDTFNKSNDELESSGTKQARSIEEACKRVAEDEREKPANRFSHPLFQASKEIFLNCHSILACHDLVKKEMASKDVASFPVDQWQEDNSLVQDYLVFGRKYGAKLVDCATTLDSDLEALKGDRRDQLPETGIMAINIYEKSANALGEDTVAHAVAAQLKAVSALVETAFK